MPTGTVRLGWRSNEFRASPGSGARATGAPWAHTLLPTAPRFFEVEPRSTRVVESQDSAGQREMVRRLYPRPSSRHVTSTILPITPPFPRTSCARLAFAKSRPRFLTAALHPSADHDNDAQVPDSDRLGSVAHRPSKGP